VLVLAAALSLWRFDAFQLGVYGDDAQYVVLARSLADGPVYGLVSRPDIPASKFPFGWPLLLAPLVALSGGEYGMLKVASLLFTLANVALIVLGWSHLIGPAAGAGPARRLGQPGHRWHALALPVGLLYATSPLVVDHSRMVMSEPAFLFFALAGLLLTTARPDTAGRRVFFGIALGIVWVMAAYTRTIGVALVAASASWLLLQRRYGRLLLGAVAAAVFVALLVAATPLRWGDLIQGGRYVTELISEPAVVDEHDLPADAPAGDAPVETLSLTTRIAYGLRGYGGTTVRDTLVPFIGGRTVARLLSPLGLGRLPGLASAAILLAIAAGFVVSLRPPMQRSTLSGAGVGPPAQSKGTLSGWASGPGAAWQNDARSQKGLSLQPIHLYVVLYTAVTILWMWALPRLLYGVLPFLIGFLLLGLCTAADWIVHLLRRGAPRPARLTTAFVACVVCVLFVANVVASLRIRDSRNHTPDLSAGTTWIAANAPSDSVVFAINPEVVFIYADRQTIPLVGAVETISSTLANHGMAERPAYLFLTPNLAWNDDGALEISPWVTSLHAELSASPHVSLAYADVDQQVFVYAWQPDGDN